MTAPVHQGTTDINNVHIRVHSMQTGILTCPLNFSLRWKKKNKDKLPWAPYLCLVSCPNVISMHDPLKRLFNTGMKNNDNVAKRTYSGL